jgi:predicted amidohydrolase YtcJ
VRCDGPSIRTAVDGSVESVSESFLIVNASVGWRTGMSVVIRNGVVSEIGSRRALPGMNVINARGGSVLPALWDHHVHLRSLAARRHSLDVSAVTDPATLTKIVRQAAQGNTPDTWLRIVGYDHDALGSLDAHRLEELLPLPIPIKIQHRSGHQWVLNRKAMDLLQDATGKTVPDDGVLFDNDSILGAMPHGRTGDADVAREARLLAGQGCVGATDMTATTDAASARQLVRIVRPWIDLAVFGRIHEGADEHTGPVRGTKILVADHDLPGLDELERQIRRSRPGPVALHAVTYEALLLVMSALESAGRQGDRVEHAFLTPQGYPRRLGSDFHHRQPPSIGAHPGFIWSQGNRLKRILADREQDDYQTLRSWHTSGFRLFGGTDAPYGAPSLWQSMQCAVDRRTPHGHSLNPVEALTPEEAFTMFTPNGLKGHASVPMPRVGQLANLCILAQPWSLIRTNLSAARVTTTLRAGANVVRRTLSASLTSPRYEHAESPPVRYPTPEARVQCVA